MMDEGLGSLFVVIARERPSMVAPRVFAIEMTLRFNVDIDSLCTLKLETFLKELLGQIVGADVLEIEIREVER